MKVRTHEEASDLALLITCGASLLLVLLLAVRKTGIGASEAPAACGISPYRQPLDIYLEKRGEIKPQEKQ